MNCSTLSLVRPTIRAGLGFTARSTPRLGLVHVLASRSRIPPIFNRSLITTASRATTSTSSIPTSASDPATASTTLSQDQHAYNTLPPAIYTGPLTTTFRRLKIFSLSSCALTVVFTPFLFMLESSLPFIAQATLAGTVLSTTVISTALVGWTGKPYVTSLQRTADGTGIEMSTATMTLRPLTTTVYDPVFLAPTRRPFAAWQLAPSVRIPAATAPVAGTEETVAETRDAKGEVKGRWIVTWGEGGEGTCRESGQIIRYFHVHEELLDPSLRLGGSASTEL